jgi:hypothetical protein
MMITQLRDVRPAGESTEMTMKDHQKPIAFVIIEMMGLAIAVMKVEWNGQLVCEAFHG